MYLDATFATTEQGGLRQVPIPPGYDAVSWDNGSSTIVDRFRKVVLSHADRLAVHDAGVAWTYAELDSFANRIANSILQRLPASPSPIDGHPHGSLEDTASPVTVLLGQGVGSVAAIIGVLKAGKTVVPLDPTDAPRRIKKVLADTGSRLLITNSVNYATACDLASPSHAVINLDKIESHASDSDPLIEINAEQLAYIVYTSGSTGEPKGVMHRHRSLYADVWQKSTVHRICANDRCSLLSSATGQALKNVFLAFANGASIFPVDTRRVGFSSGADWLRDNRISVLTIATPLYRTLLRNIRPDAEFRDLRLIRLASDCVRPQDVIGFQERFADDCVLLNALSTSETGSVCGYVFDKNSRLKRSEVPVGFPFNGNQIALLNEDESVEYAAFGNIGVTGQTVFCGYWRRPDLTAQAFVTDSAAGGRPVYRTNDLARLREDGALVLLGRSDNQVKIRGFLVEVPEVEAVLLEHPQVRDAIVHPWENDAGHRRLVGYWVPESQPEPRANELRDFLAERLADSMIPSSFVKLDAIPQLPNGKADRRALPPPATHRDGLSNDYVAPTGSTESELVTIWSNVLSFNNIGVDDEFLELGGDSLLAIQVAATCSTAFGIQLPLVAVFETRTIRGLARRIDQLLADESGDEALAPIVRRGDQTTYTPAYGQQSLWLLNQFDRESAAYNMPNAVRLVGALNVEALAETVRQVIQRHQILRTTYAHGEDGPVAAVTDRCEITLPLVDLSLQTDAAQESELQRWMAEETARPFDLSADLMLRCTLFRLAEHEHILLLVTHHIASDRESSFILVDEVARIYAAIRHDQTPTLPDPPIQFGDFARWQRSQLQDGTSNNKLAAWTKVLAHAPATTSFPTDYPRPARQAFAGARHTFTIHRSLKESLLQFARQERTTAFVTLLAAMKAQIFARTHQSDLIVGCPVTGRGQSGTENLIGYFANVLPLRTQLDRRQSLRDLVHEVRRGTLQMLSLSEVPFEMIVSRMLKQRDVSRHPIFQIVFDVYKAREQVMELSELSISRVSVERCASPFDLGWSFAITSGEIQGRVEYDTALFSHGTIESLAAQFVESLEGALAQPEASLTDLLPKQTDSLQPTAARNNSVNFRARTGLEGALRAIWCEVLGIEEIGVDDDFFALGGNSLLATRVCSKIKAELEVELPLRCFFDFSTISRLTHEISSSAGTARKTDHQTLRRRTHAGQIQFPLSFAQERLWFFEQMEPDETAYNMPYAWRLRGGLDAEALRRALETIVRRHEPLRTTFTSADGVPLQVIQDIERFELPIEDLSETEAHQRETEIVRCFRAEAERRFDLSRDLMLRARLLRITDAEHVLLITMHQVASDGWSLTLLSSELQHLYDAYARQEKPLLRELPVRYVDYALWQRDELSGERLETLVRYWRTHLDGMRDLELPTDRPRPRVPNYVGERYEFELTEELADHLRSLSQSQRVTLQMTLLAAWKCLLFRYCGQDDVTVGTPISGRNRVELESQIGFFVNTLPLRTDLSGNPTFRQLLGRVREVSLAAYEHQDLPLQQLASQIATGGQAGRSQPVRVLFQFLTVATGNFSLSGLEVSAVPRPSARVRFDLEIALHETPKSIQARMLYSHEQFDAETIQRMAGHWLTLLQSVVADPDQAIAEIPMISQSERYELLVARNDTCVEYPHRCVHQLFEEQVARTPYATAVVGDDGELTYQELNLRANQVAHYLRRRGVGLDSRVALCLERSCELVIGMLGILKAGAAYVPLDTDYPCERLQMMLDDASVDQVLTQSSLADRLPSDRMICWDRDRSQIESQSRSNPPVAGNANSLAYVMFTSGSTGRPKGVEIRHTSIARLVFGNDYATFGADRVFLQLATVSFDASTFELWGALLHGAKLVLAPPDLPELDQLEALLKRHRVTTLWLTATLFNQIIDQRPQALAEVKEVLTGGEALSVSHILRAQETLGSKVQLINGYGPTECTTFATTFRIPHPIEPDWDSIPIGRPMANTQVYVLDASRNLVPMGVPGELFIGGAGLARGYLNRAELTADRFVPNPFSDAQGDRLYRTGDRCRWRADGTLEFMGRLDDQIKLRGFRIELGEIESTLNSHPDVAQSVVTVREDRPGDRRLVAYWVAASGQHANSPAQHANSAALREFLESRLPGYMVPANLVALESLPLTSSGKVDRQALAAPGRLRPEQDSEYMAPQTPTERKVAAIWSDLLGIDEVGVNDDFFVLGGYSLLAMTLLARIEREFGQTQPLRDFLQLPTVRQQASSLNQEQESAAFPLIVDVHQPAVAQPSERPILVVVPGLFGGVSEWRTFFDCVGFDRRVRGLELAGGSNYSHDEPTLEQIAEMMVQVLRPEVQPRSFHLIGHSFGAHLAYEIGQQMQNLGCEPFSVTLVDTQPHAVARPIGIGDVLALSWNIPRWIANEWTIYGPRSLLNRVTRRTVGWFGRVLGRGLPVEESADQLERRAVDNLQQMFDLSEFPEMYRHRLIQGYTAVANYRTQPTLNRVIHLKSRVRPLKLRLQSGEGWSTMVQPDCLTERSIPGDHGNPFHPRWRTRLAQILSQTLDDVERHR